MRSLFIILARGGSKGLPGKNIKPMLGKPLIAYSIQEALKSKYCTDLILSTDDLKIAEIGKEYGAKVPFMRPKELAADTSTSADAIIHAISFMAEQGLNYDYIVLFEPTSPLRKSEDVDKAIEMLHDNPKAETCVSVTLSESGHPTFLFSKEENDIIKSYVTDDNVVRRQDLNKLYYPEGSFYISKCNTFIVNKTFYTKDKTIGFEVPKWMSFEIDTMEDFLIVELLMQAKIQGKFNSIK